MSEKFSLNRVFRQSSDPLPKQVSGEAGMRICFNFDNLSFDESKFIEHNEAIRHFLLKAVKFVHYFKGHRVFGVPILVVLL